ncbi:helix-turn-helix domain-containing protein [Echinicola sp. 20G]|uniref:XRE family transcriptional regulator n=1 Tax=Echinicola sp. 20G TaxID=2781961 RepID=UPI0019100BB7|nr:helix-turn-helix domain-containing protein [Echinicola sp. 20G]
MSNPILFWSSNIKFLRKRKKMSQMELAEKLNISRPKVNTHENGHVKNPPMADMVLFADFFRMSIDSLVKVDLSKLSELKIRDLEAGNDVYLKGGSIRILATTVDSDNRENVELVPVKAKAGYLAGYSDPGFISRLPVFHLPQLDPNRKYRMFPTEGDSMLPVPEGALVIGEFLQDWTHIKERTPCIVVTKEEGISFKLASYRIKESKSLLLESLNTLYEPYEVDVMEVLEVWKFHSYFTEDIPGPMSSLEQVGRDVREIKATLHALNNVKN